MSTNIFKKEQNLTNISFIDKLKQDISFIRYFLYIFLPFIGGIYLPELLQESLPSTEQEVMLSILIFFSAQIILFSILLREILSNEDYKIVLGLSGVLSSITSILFMYTQLPFDYVLIGRCIGFIVASISGIILVQWDSLAYQERYFSNHTYTGSEEEKFTIAENGLIITTLQGSCTFIIKNVPASALELLSTILLEFECSLEEEYDKISIKYTPIQQCFFLQKTATKDKMIRQYQTLMNELKKLNILD